jgi:hypothetical protein
MKNKMTVAAILAALLLGGAYYLRAQMDNYTDTNMDDPRRQEERQPAGPRQMMGMPGGMGGGAAMAVFERHIYVLSGNTLYKVDPADMKVVKELQLRRPGAPAGAMGRPGTMGGQ